MGETKRRPAVSAEPESAGEEGAAVRRLWLEARVARQR